MQALATSFCQKSALAIVFYPVACSGNTLVNKVRDAQLGIEWMNRCSVSKGHPPSADLRYGEEDSISPSTLIVVLIKSKLRIKTIHIPLDVLKKLALR